MIPPPRGLFFFPRNINFLRSFFRLLFFWAKTAATVASRRHERSSVITGVMRPVYKRARGTAVVIYQFTFHQSSPTTTGLRIHHRVVAAMVYNNIIIHSHTRARLHGYIFMCVHCSTPGHWFDLPDALYASLFRYRIIIKLTTANRLLFCIRTTYQSVLVTTVATSPGWSTYYCVYYGEMCSY